MARWWLTFFDDADPPALLGGVIVTGLDSETEAQAYARANALYPEDNAAGTAAHTVTTRTVDDYPESDDTFIDSATVEDYYAQYDSPRIHLTPAAGEDRSHLVGKFIYPVSYTPTATQLEPELEWVRGSGGFFFIDPGAPANIYANFDADLVAGGVVLATLNGIKVLPRPTSGDKISVVRVQLNAFSGLLGPGGFFAQPAFEVQDLTNGFEEVEVPTLSTERSLLGPYASFRAQVYVETLAGEDWFLTSSSAATLQVRQL